MQPTHPTSAQYPLRVKSRAARDVRAARTTSGGAGLCWQSGSSDNGLASPRALYPESGEGRVPLDMLYMRAIVQTMQIHACVRVRILDASARLRDLNEEGEGSFGTHTHRLGSGGTSATAFSPAGHGAELLPSTSPWLLCFYSFPSTSLY